MTTTIQIKHQNFELHPSGALFWKEKSAVMISDVHLGKVSHFRKYGAAIPVKAIEKNFELLDTVIAHFCPKIICFLGDLFHSYLNSEWRLFENWVQLKSEEIILVSGNHDIISPLKYENLGVRVVAEILLDGFLLTHHPEERIGLFNFSGHIHPAVRLKGTGRQSLRLPCFFKSKNQMILPAFGAFTGSHVLKKNNSHEVYAIADSSIIKL